MDFARSRKARIVLLTGAASLLAACGGGSTSGSGGTCARVDQVSQGNATVRIENLGSTTIEAYLGPQVSFSAVLRPGECNLIGIQLPASYTLRTTVEITQCTYDPDQGCSGYFGPKKYESLVLPIGQTVTITVGSGYFGSDPGSNPPPQTTYAISGMVSGAAVDGLVIGLGGSAYRTTTTSGGGTFSFTGLANGSYAVYPLPRAGYTFSPPSINITVNGANVTGLNFTSTGSAPTTYSISGVMSGAATDGVLVTLSGAASSSAITAGGGFYTLTGLANGTYTATPSLAGFTFTPPSRQVVVNGQNVTGANFTATAVQSTYSISGTVSGAATDGVLVTLSGSPARTTTTSGGGAYTFSGLANGTYTVTPSLAGFTFTPPSRQVVVSGANVNGASFTATSTAPATYSLSGGIYAVPYSLVTLTLSGPVSATTNGGSAGSGFIFNGLPNGLYTVTPSGAGYVFAPQARQVVIQDGSVSGLDFVGRDVGASTYYISGAVWGAAADGVLLTIGGGASGTATTSAGGVYTFGWLPNGTYTITPSKAGFTFAPPSSQVVVNGANVTGMNFSAVATASTTHSISGAISGSTADGVLVTLSGAASRTTTTANGGLYSFSGLVNGTYAVTPSLTGSTFSPPSAQIVVSGADVTGVAFIAGATSAPSIGGTPPASATVMTAYSFTPSSGGATSFTMAGTLPPGLSFSGTTGAVTGTPTTAGTYGGIVITAHNNYGSADLPAFAITVGEATWDIAGQYSLANNPSGAWSYGYKLVPTGDLTLMTYILRNQDGTFWIRANGIWSPSIVAPGIFAGPQLWAGQNTSGIPAIRWTCSTPGTYRVRMTFTGNDGATRVLVAIVNGSATVFSGAVQALGSTASHDSTVSLQAGDHLDFVVSWDGTSSYTPGGWTGITGTVSTVTQ